MGGHLWSSWCHRSGEGSRCKITPSLRRKNITSRGNPLTPDVDKSLIQSSPSIIIAMPKTRQAKLVEDRYAFSNADEFETVERDYDTYDRLLQFWRSGFWTLVFGFRTQTKS